MTAVHVQAREALPALRLQNTRQCPGDDAFCLDLLRRLPKLFPRSIADIGCGSGASSLLLAQQYQQSILCVDPSQDDLDVLMASAQSAGLSGLITTLCADLGELDPRSFRVDLLWSEGATGSMTFVEAMQKWRPLMLRGGTAVISELNWFHRDQPPDAFAYWSNAYPNMSSEFVNQAIAEQYRFKLLFKERLPAEALWESYYKPLVERFEAEEAVTASMEAVVTQILTEVDLFTRYAEDFGYTYYVLQAV